ncbi:hypothetical protein B0H14DRAFT_2615637 [Mycena olivaceomarginata]|nr:hypothetical protein B0H14DRAFT_2615637 [Mycena olivaceomarginata]
MFGVPRSVDIAQYETRHLAVNGVHESLSFNKNWDCYEMDKWFRTLFPVYFAHMDKHYPLDAMHKFHSGWKSDYKSDSYTMEEDSDSEESVQNLISEDDFHPPQQSKKAAGKAKARSREFSTTAN